MRGLVNLGNTCYFNAAVQTLAHVPALSNHLLRNGYEGHCEVTKEYQKVVKELWSAVVGPVDPSSLLTVFRTRFRTFANSDQHDAQEVIICLVDIFEHSLGAEFIKNIFNGQESQETVYPGGVSKIPGTFTTLVLIPTGPCKLEDLLISKSKHEVIEGYTDDSGKTHNVAAVRTVVTHWPDILMVTFGMYGGKVAIDLPEELPGGYKLFIIVIHMGIACGGHYAMLVNRKGKWFLKDDESIEEKTVSNPIRGPFYMAIYRK
jgi:ubiquitin C-terminal hydrolase